MKIQQLSWEGRRCIGQGRHAGVVSEIELYNNNATLRSLYDAERFKPTENN
jgi:hypothetical protein